MSPKEKAKELYFKMLNGFQFTIDSYTAKQCALYTANEILKEMSEYADFYDCTITFEKCDYWEEVKQEIEKIMTHDQIIQTLKDDNEYYNGLGRSYLSNSDIGVLLNNPVMFKKKSEKTLAMLQGSYFHTACLEPHKLKSFPLVDASTRTTNIYKDACKESNEPFMLLVKEAEEVDEMVKALRANTDLSKLVWDSGIKYEVPAIGEIEGLQWKGKADIINGDFIYDLKTTTSLDDFKYSAKKYNYDSQAFIYNHLFGKELAFIVIEKGSNRLGFFECSDEFMESGRMKVEQAMGMYYFYHSPNATKDVNQYYVSKVLF